MAVKGRIKGWLGVGKSWFKAGLGFGLIQVLFRRCRLD